LRELTLRIIVVGILSGNFWRFHQVVLWVMILFFLNLFVNLLNLSSISTFSKAIESTKVSTNDFLHILESCLIRWVLFRAFPDRLDFFVNIFIFWVTNWLVETKIFFNLLV
jgi:hypothetical protein